MTNILTVCSVAKSCPALCDPMDCSPPGSSVHGIFQARTLEWVAISFSRGLTVYGKIKIDETFPNPELLVWIIKLFVNPKIPVHKIKYIQSKLKPGGNARALPVKHSLRVKISSGVWLFLHVGTSEKCGTALSIPSELDYKTSKKLKNMSYRPGGPNLWATDWLGTRPHSWTRAMGLQVDAASSVSTAAPHHSPITPRRDCLGAENKLRAPTDSALW